MKNISKDIILTLLMVTAGALIAFLTINHFNTSSKIIWWDFRPTGSVLFASFVFWLIIFLTIVSFFRLAISTDEPTKDSIRKRCIRLFMNFILGIIIIALTLPSALFDTYLLVFYSRYPNLYVVGNVTASNTFIKLQCGLHAPVTNELPNVFNKETNQYIILCPLQMSINGIFYRTTTVTTKQLMANGAYQATLISEARVRISV